MQSPSPSTRVVPAAVPPLSCPIRLELEAASPTACNHAEDGAAPPGLAVGQAEPRHADCLCAGRTAAVHVQPARLKLSQSAERAACLEPWHGYGPAADAAARRRRAGRRAAAQVPDVGQRDAPAGQGRHRQGDRPAGQPLACAAPRRRAQLRPGPERAACLIAPCTRACVCQPMLHCAPRSAALCDMQFCSMPCALLQRRTELPSEPHMRRGRQEVGKVLQAEYGVPPEYVDVKAKK